MEFQPICSLSFELDLAPCSIYLFDFHLNKQETLRPNRQFISIPCSKALLFKSLFPSPSLELLTGLMCCPNLESWNCFSCNTAHQTLLVARGTTHKLILPVISDNKWLYHFQTYIFQWR